MNYPNPCDNCESVCGRQHGCGSWQMRFRTIWKQFNTYQLRQYRKGPRRVKFAYEHPDLIRKYLQEGPCKGCKLEEKCETPCNTYWHWWDARMTLFKKQYGLE